MKHQVSKVLMVLLLLFTAISCKNEKKQEEAPLKEITFNGTRSVDFDQSTILWKGYKLFGNHSGDIKLKEGFLIFNSDGLIGGTFVADMNSIRVTELMDDDDEEEEENEGGDEEGEDDKSDLANHLKDADFFDAQTYPTATFVIKDVSKQVKDYILKGDITIKDKTVPIEFPVQINGNWLKGTASIDRTKFGIKYGSGSFFDNLGDNVIKDKFDLIISLKIAG